MTSLKPFYENVQAHYDLSDEFFALFLDPTRTYSCAYFQRDDMTLEEAQWAKIDLSLGKCDLHPGQTLLDIGCGWGTTAIRAVEKYGVRAIGLTLSKNQQAYASQRVASLGSSSDQTEFRLQGWEEYSGPTVDRIVSIGAFEHFRAERHAEFFAKCKQILAPGGRMMLHTIVLNSLKTFRELGIELTEEDVAFAKFIRREIFPGGQLCVPDRIEDFAREAGFGLVHRQSLQLHYARTLETWHKNLSAVQTQATELTSPEIFLRYEKYLSGCAERFRKGNIDVIQFVLQA